MSQQATINRHFEQIATRDELRNVPLIGSDDWLHPLEQEELDQLRDPGRREAWRCGRWLSKQITLQALDFSTCELSTIAIQSRSDLNKSVRPTITFEERSLPWSLSISHSDDTAIAVLATDPKLTVGVDLTPIQPLSNGFLTSWFSPAEQYWSRSADKMAAATIWAAKEAIYKAYNQGESFAPRRIEISQDKSGKLTGRYWDCDLISECSVESRVVGSNVVVVAIRTDQYSNNTQEEPACGSSVKPGKEIR